MTIQGLEKDARLRVWAESICECKRSGKKVYEWCRENGINKKTYYYRFKQVSNALGSEFQRQYQLAVQSEVMEPVTQLSWQPVQLTEAEKPITRKSIVLHIGRCNLEVDESTDLPWLAQVVEALTPVC